jgi:hypothetical protein
VKCTLEKRPNGAKLETLETRRLLSIFGDFSGDGRYDALSAFQEKTSGAVTDAGAVLVMYGKSVGLTSDGSQVFTQDMAGVADAGEAGDQFGAALSAGDFNNDGFADLAIGAPGESIRPLRSPRFARFRRDRGAS